MKLLILTILLSALPVAAQMHKLCGSCHTQPTDDYLKHPHSKQPTVVNCDTCHGASDTHINTAGNTPPDKVAGPKEQPALCGACHTGPNKGFMASKHAKTLLAGGARRAPACTTCHGNHRIRTAAQTELQCKRCHDKRPAACSAAPPAKTAKVSCANCHDKHTMVVAKR